MLTLILPALLLTGAGPSKPAEPAQVRTDGAITAACVNNGYNKVFQFQEGPSTPKVEVYSGSIGCAAEVADGAKFKTVPAVMKR